VIVKGTLQNPDIFGRKWGYRADLTHIDGVIRVLAAGLDPGRAKTAGGEVSSGRGCLQFGSQESSMFQPL
jgi:hypothetical protein